MYIICILLITLPSQKVNTPQNFLISSYGTTLVYHLDKKTFFLKHYQVGKGVCEILEFNYELFTSSNTLCEKLFQCIIYIYIKARKVFTVSHQFVCNNISLWTSRNPRTQCAVRLSLIMKSCKHSFLFFYLSPYPMISVCDNTFHNPRSTQCLHQKTWGSLGDAVDNNMVSTISHIASIGLK